MILTKTETAVYNFNLILAKNKVKNRLHLHKNVNGTYNLSIASRITSLNAYIPQGRQTIVPLSADLTCKQVIKHISTLQPNIFNLPL